MTGLSWPAADEDRGRTLAGWRNLGAAIALLATAVVLAVTTQDSHPAPAHASPARSSSRPAAGARSHGCVATAGYGGLGAPASAFAGNNNGSTGHAEPTPGTAWYVVTATANGCVTGFSLQDDGSPPPAARYLLLLVSYPYLPRDAERVVYTNTCAVWTSASLRRATGRAYATANAIAQVGRMPGRAQIESTIRPGCS